MNAEKVGEAGVGPEVRDSSAAGAVDPVSALPHVEPSMPAAGSDPNAGRRLLRNATSLLAAQVTTWMLTMVFTIVLRRVLGPAATGDLTIQFSLWGTLSTFAVFGMDTYVAKEVAHDHGSAQRMFGTTVYLRAVAYVLIALGVLAFGLAQQKSSSELVIEQVFGLGALFVILAGGASATLQGLESIHYLSLATVGSKAVNTALGVIALVLGGRVLSIGWVGVAAALVYLGIQVYFLFRSHHVWPKFDRTLWMPMLLRSAPFVVNGMVLVGYQQADVLILQKFVSREEIGWFGATQQLIGTMLFGITAFTTALFPQMTRAHKENPRSLSRMVGGGAELMWWLSLPMAAGVAVVSKLVIVLLYGPKFEPAATLLAYSGALLVQMHLNTLVATYLTATERQYVATILVMAGLVLKVPVNLLLLGPCRYWFGPNLGVMAGILSTGLAELVMFVVMAGFYLPPGTLSGPTLWRATKVAIASGLMALTAHYAAHYGLAPAIATGVVTYGVLTYVLGTLAPDQQAVVGTILRKMAGRLPPSLRRLVSAG